MQLDGLLNLNKPVGITSARALDRVRRATGQRKSGHAGTLDPAADGVLLIGLGKGTKLVERLMDLPKRYRATLRLDATSDSFDSEAEVRPVEIEGIPTRAAVDAALAAQVGEIWQMPPRISALKVGGRPAYKLARSGADFELRPRQISIYEARVLTYEWPTLEIDVACGRGAYIRAIARDLGLALSTGGCLTALTRTEVGPFNLSNAVTLDALTERGPSAALALEAVENLLRDFRASGSLGTVGS